MAQGCGHSALPLKVKANGQDQGPHGGHGLYGGGGGKFSPPGTIHFLYKKKIPRII